MTTSANDWTGCECPECRGDGCYEWDGPDDRVVVRRCDACEGDGLAVCEAPGCGRKADDYAQPDEEGETLAACERHLRLWGEWPARCPWCAVEVRVGLATDVKRGELTQRHDCPECERKMAADAERRGRREDFEAAMAEERRQ